MLIEQRAALVRRSGAPGQQTPRSTSATLASSPHSELVDALVEYAHAVYGHGCRYTRAGAPWCGWSLCVGRLQTWVVHRVGLRIPYAQNV